MKNAFSSWQFERKEFMEIPHGLDENIGPGKVCRQKKALYNRSSHLGHGSGDSRYKCDIRKAKEIICYLLNIPRELM